MNCFGNRLTRSQSILLIKNCRTRGMMGRSQRKKSSSHAFFPSSFTSYFFLSLKDWRGGMGYMRWTNIPSRGRINTHSRIITLPKPVKTQKILLIVKRTKKRAERPWYLKHLWRNQFYDRKSSADKVGKSLTKHANISSMNWARDTPIRPWK